MPLINLVGQRFRRLEVLALGVRRPGGARWLCRCDCGVEITVRASCLKSGNTQSCGCLKIDSATRHGHNPSQGRPSKTYNSWQAMITRCTKTDSDRYEYYGGAGIRVCEPWLDFRNFLADMGERPAGMTLDRIDSTGHYEPGNCRWATPKQQSANRRCTPRCTFNGETLTVAEWAARFNLPRVLVVCRLKAHWSVEKALRTPYKPYNITH